jgi:uracil-DNA glycosylase
MENWSELSWWGSPTQTSVENAVWKTDYLPHYDRWYRALARTPFDKVKVVILGQDPYHTPGVANGLAFSTDPHVRVLPPSLRNIFRELVSDIAVPQPRTGDLTPWAERGVLLLNTSLTVEPGKPGSHRDIGWDVFTTEVIKSLNEHRKNLVFLLWGRHAQSFHPLITAKRHHVLRSPHPSPYSAGTGFFGSKPFSRANDYLVSKGKEPVNWRLS